MSVKEIRTARLEDRETVLAFCSNTFPEGDYIEHVWDSWLQDPTGQLFVATIDGQPAGIAHIQMLSDEEAWLQGLRVDPAYRRQGLARALSETASAEAMRRGATIIRLVVNTQNTTPIHLYKSMHMRPVGDFIIYQAAPFSKPVARPPQQHTQLATSDDLDSIIDYLNASNIFPLVGGLYYHRFKGYSITAKFLEQKIAAQQIYLLQRWERLDGLAIAEITTSYQNQQRLSVGYIDGTAIEAISLIAYDLRQRLNTLPAEQVQVYAPNTLLIQDAFAGVEYTPGTSINATYERALQ